MSIQGTDKSGKFFLTNAKNGWMNVTGRGGADSFALKLTGGDQKDVFVFNGALDEGRDVITDFQDDLDLIKIEGEDFGDLNIVSTGPGGANTLIELDSGTEIILKNIAMADISSDDFVFV